MLSYVVVSAGLVLAATGLASPSRPNSPLRKAPADATFRKADTVGLAKRPN